MGETPGLRAKYFRTVVRTLILGDSFVQGEPYFFRWSEFLPACKNTEVIPLKEDHEITDAELSDWKPPSGSSFVPIDPTQPPLEEEQNEGNGVNFLDYTDFVQNQVIPWMDWANIDGPCQTYVEDWEHNGIDMFEGMGFTPESPPGMQIRID